MKYYISYFYQVRFMKPYHIPLSTAIWGPSWYKQGNPWVDKNGVMNGLRADVFAPDQSCEGLCRGREDCSIYPSVPPWDDLAQTCPFLQAYWKQLSNLNFQEIISRCENLAQRVKSYLNFSQEPVIILLVHEAPNNPCSERRIIQKWFATNGVELKEWNKNLSC